MTTRLGPTLNPNLTKQHLKTPIFKSYIVYVQKFYPQIDIASVCEKAGLPLDYLLNENNWVSILFERDFMAELMKTVKADDFISDVGRFGVKPEVMGKSIHFLCARLLALSTVYEKLPFVTSLLNKVIILKTRTHYKNTIIFEIKPNLTGLTKYESEVLLSRLPDFIRSIEAYYSAIPTERGLPNSKITVATEQIDNVPSYTVSVTHPMDISKVFCIPDLLIASSAFVASGVLSWVLNLIAHQRILLLAAGALIGLFYLILKKLSDKNTAIQQTTETLQELDKQYHELHDVKVDLSRKLAESSAINQIIAQIASENDELDVLAHACRLLSENLKYDRSVVLTADEGSKNLKFATGCGLSDELRNGLLELELKIDIESFEKNKISNVYRLETPILIEDVKSHIHTLVDRDSKLLLTASGSTSFCAVPIMTSKGKYGVLIADCHESQKVLAEADLSLLNTVARQVAIAIEKIRAKDSLKLALQKTELMKDSYSRFVPFETLKKLNYDSILDVKLGDGLERNLTILFSDIRSFSTLCEKMTSGEILKFLNSYFGKLSPIIKKNNGIIDKFIGDCMMAIFDSPSDAINAGIQIQRDLVVYNVERRLGGRAPVFAGIGICQGSVVMGPLGFDGRLEITVLSDTVNIASRLDGLCKDLDAKILVSGVNLEVYKQLPEEISILDHGSQKVKGRFAGVDVYEIVDQNILDAFNDNPGTEEYIRYKEEYINHVLRKLQKVKKVSKVS